MNADRMDFTRAHRLPPNAEPRLAAIATDATGPFAGKDEARDYLEETVKRIRKLQYRLFVERKRSLLIVLQAPDAAGKDGLIRKVLGRMNPQGCRTFPFKTPTQEELAHDFLWRVHQCTPAKGMISVFNRSHYEDVLIVRVENLVPRDVLSERYEFINDFERNLAAAGTRILKFYLHISPEEQLERFRKRLENPDKHWKLNVADYAAREKWDAYREAYEQVFARCNGADAPWHVIPADRKWYRDAAVAGILRSTLEAMDPRPPEADVDLAEIRALFDREEAELRAAAKRREKSRRGG